MGICNQSICGASEWGDLLLLVIGRFAGISNFGIIGLVIRKGHAGSVIGRPVTINDRSYRNQ